MPISFPLDKIKIMEKAGVQAKFCCFAGNPSDPDPKKQSPRHICEMVDDTTGEVVTKAEAEQKITAYEKAVDALSAMNRKPAMQSLEDAKAAAERERDELKAKLAALTKK